MAERIDKIMNTQREQFVWCEKYRPKTIDDCVLPKSIRASIEGIMTHGDLPNLLFSGKSGVGKTTVARALAFDLDMDSLIINASDENGIDVLRSKLKEYASSMSFDGKRKIIVLDEADYLSPAAQPALRGFMEEFSKTCSFIFTCNHSNRIIPALHSRCSVISFTVPKHERPEMMAQFAKRALEILDTEHVTYDKALVLEVLRLYFPDFRRTLNELQRFSATGALQSEILAQISDKDVMTLMKALSSANFVAVRKWISDHEDADEAAFYRMLSETVPKHVKPDELPNIILTMADYSYRSAFAADKSLNMLACLVEIMSHIHVTE